MPHNKNKSAKLTQPSKLSAHFADNYNGYMIAMPIVAIFMSAVRLYAQGKAQHIGTGAICGTLVGMSAGLLGGVYAASQEEAYGIFGRYTQFQHGVRDIFVGFGGGGVGGLVLGVSAGAVSGLVLTAPGAALVGACAVGISAYGLFVNRKQVEAERQCALEMSKKSI